jgi:sterol desaturase/sphingolipid hydroxylase (fatty acid hydroxylase superfamily)
VIEELKMLLRASLGPFYDVVVSLVWTVFPFFGSHNLHWIFIASTLAITLWIYSRSLHQNGAKSFRGFIEFLVPKRIYLHPSAVLDYKFYVVNSLLLAQLRLGALVGAVAGLLYVADSTKYLLAALFGPGPEHAQSSGWARLGFTLAIVLAADFAKFAAHYLQHKVPVLWEFHKVHHAAEVLTPITNLRLHPVDFLFEQFLVALTTGVIAGAFAYRYPDGILEITIFNIGLVYFVYFLSSNLRHSHIPLAFGWRTSHVLSSPVMHQIHHSAEARHFDKNFALIFSFWDYLVGALYIPRSKEEFRLGLGPDGGSQGLNSLWALYVQPFVAAVDKLRRPPSSGSDAAAT